MDCFKSSYLLYGMLTQEGNQYIKMFSSFIRCNDVIWRVAILFFA